VTAHHAAGADGRLGIADPTLTCPNGHRFRSKPIVFGLPDGDGLEQAKRGEIVLGGCAPDVPIEIPCPDCGAIALAEYQRRGLDDRL
jgi:hypothetical protein